MFKWFLKLMRNSARPTLSGRTRDRRKQFLHTSRPRLERLEDRVTPVVVVHGVTDLNTMLFYGTIQAAVNAASPGDVLLATPGTFSENVTINKSLTLEGYNHGVNPNNTTRNPESIIDDTANGGITPLTIAANDVVVDGFTISGGTSANNVGAGVYIEPGFHGTHFINNIVQNNIIGLYLANSSPTDQAVLQYNLFQNNTESGPSGGTDIYADQYTAGVGGVNDALINSNTFTNTSFVEDAWALGISNTASTQFSNITFSDNTVTYHGRGVYFFDTTDSTVTGNSITGASHYAIGFFGQGGTPASPANSSFTVTNNTINVAGSGGAGVELVDDTSDGPTGYAYSGTLTLSGDSYTTSGSDQSIDNESATPITATGETFNTVLASTATPSQIFTIENTITDAIDNPSYGLVTLQTGNVFVTPSSPSSLQNAINAASPGSTIYVAAGTYSPITVNKSLTIIGVGPTSIIDASTMATGVYITASNVSISGFEIKGTGTTDQGVWIDASGASLSGDSLTDLTITGTSSYIADDGIRVDKGGSGHSITGLVVTGNSISDIGDPPGYGLFLNGVTGPMTISGNSFMNLANDPTYPNVSLPNNIAVSTASVGVFVENSTAITIDNTNSYSNLNLAGYFAPTTSTSSFSGVAANFTNVGGYYVNGHSPSNTMSVTGLSQSVSTNNVAAGAGSNFSPLGNVPNLFATIQDGIDFSAASATVTATAGTFAEDDVVYKPLTLLGAEANQSATTRFGNFVSGEANPAVETIITAPSVNPGSVNPGSGGNVLVQVTTTIPGVTINGFVVDGSNPNLNPYGTIDAQHGITSYNSNGAPTLSVTPSSDTVAVSDVTVENDIVQNVSAEGIAFDNGTGTPVTTGSQIMGNVVNNANGDSIGLFDNFYASVQNNTIIEPAFDEFAGIDVQGYNAGSSSITLSGNTLTIGQTDFGIWFNLISASGATFTVSSNTVNAASGVTPNPSDFPTIAYELTSISSYSTFSLTGNLTGTSGGEFDRGWDFWNVPTTNPLSVSGGSVANSAIGIVMDNVDPLFGAAGVNSTVDVTGVAIDGATVPEGILVDAEPQPVFPPATVPPLFLDPSSSNVVQAPSP